MTPTEVKDFLEYWMVRDTRGKYDKVIKEIVTILDSAETLAMKDAMSRAKVKKLQLMAETAKKRASEDPTYVGSREHQQLVRESQNLTVIDFGDPIRDIVMAYYRLGKIKS